MQIKMMMRMNVINFMNFYKVDGPVLLWHPICKCSSIMQIFIYTLCSAGKIFITQPSSSSSSYESILIDLVAVIFVSAAVLLALCERMLIVPGTVGTTEVGETSSSEETSSSLTRLLERGGLLERGAGVSSISTEPLVSRLKSSSNLPMIHEEGQKNTQMLNHKK